MAGNDRKSILNKANIRKGEQSSQILFTTKKQQWSYHVSQPRMAILCGSKASPKIDDEKNIYIKTKMLLYVYQFQ